MVIIISEGLVLLITPSYAPVASVCNEKKRELLSKLETKIEAGMEKLDHAHVIVVANCSYQCVINPIHYLTLSIILQVHCWNGWYPEADSLHTEEDRLQTRGAGKC